MRGPACSALPAVCQHLDSSELTQMVRPKLLELAKDSSDLVRELLADHLIKLAPVLGKQQTIDLLLDPLLALLRDRTPEVLPPPLLPHYQSTCTHELHWCCLFAAVHSHGSCAGRSCMCAGQGAA